MKITKKLVVNLEKCYSLSKIKCNGEQKYLVASEKSHECYLLNKDLEVEDTVWNAPGGTMTIEPLDQESIFLATHKCYSPNDGADAKIVIAEKEGDAWNVRTLCDLPFVHRFGVLKRNKKQYLVAATLKSHMAFKDDWTCPGRLWVAELPYDLSSFNQDNQLKLTALESGLYKNHGFFKFEQQDFTSALFGTENGVYIVEPPKSDDDWTCTKILDARASDMFLGDFDGDGIDEMITMSPFHGDKLAVYKKVDGEYKPAFEFSESFPFLHAFCVADFNGKKVAIVGHRREKMDIFMVSYADGQYKIDIIDENVGSANVLCIEDGSKLRILSANREINEVALYEISEN